MMRIWKFAGLCCLGLSFAAKPAVAGILVTITWTYVTTEVSPSPGTHASSESSSFRMEGRRVVNPNQTNADFGQAATGANGYGSSYRATYHVANGRVIETLSFAGSTTVIAVSTNGTDSCSATVRFIKPRGKRYFEGDRQGSGEHMFMSDEHAENVACSISQG